jgi:hypothetical protein
MKFKSVEHALAWAFRVESTAIIKTSSASAAMMGGGGMSHGELTAHDRHAYAAMIIDQASRATDKPSMALLRALYGIADAADVRAYLVPIVVAALPTGVHSRRAIEDVINAYCGRNRGVEELRRALQCRKSTALETRRGAYRALDAVLERAVARIIDAEPQYLFVD